MATTTVIEWGIDVKKLENDRFEIYDRCPMSDVAMAISTDADTDADVAGLSHLAKWPLIVTS